MNRFFSDSYLYSILFQFLIPQLFHSVFMGKTKIHKRLCLLHDVKAIMRCKDICWQLPREGRSKLMWPGRRTRENKFLKKWKTHAGIKNTNQWPKVETWNQKIQASLPQREALFKGSGSVCRCCGVIPHLLAVSLT